MNECQHPAPPHCTAGEHIREQERQRITRDLHDELGSQLTAIKMALTQLRQQLTSTAGASAITQHQLRLQAQADYADQLTDGALAAMHDIIDDLYPAVLELGLADALAWLAHAVHRQSGLILKQGQDQIDQSLASTLDKFTTVSLFRVAREALNNVVRHAQAKQVEISLQGFDGQLQLRISDDGVGLPSETGRITASQGLHGMRARVAALGGQLQLLRNSAGGLTVQAEIPWPADAGHLPHGVVCCCDPQTQLPRQPLKTSSLSTS